MNDEMMQSISHWGMFEISTVSRTLAADTSGYGRQAENSNCESSEATPRVENYSVQEFDNALQSCSKRSLEILYEML